MYFYDAIVDDRFDDQFDHNTGGAAGGSASAALATTTPASATSKSVVTEILDALNRTSVVHTQGDRDDVDAHTSSMTTPDIAALLGLLVILVYNKLKLFGHRKVCIFALSSTLIIFTEQL